MKFHSCLAYLLMLSLGLSGCISEDEENSDCYLTAITLEEGPVIIDCNQKEIVNPNGVSWQSYKDIMTTVVFNWNCDDNSQIHDLHITHYRVSYYSDNAILNKIGTFDMYSDVYFPVGFDQSYGFKVLHSDQIMWICEQLNNSLTVYFDHCLKGTAVLEFWGKTNDDEMFSAALEIPIEVCFP